MECDNDGIHDNEGRQKTGSVRCQPFGRSQGIDRRNQVLAEVRRMSGLRSGESTPKGDKGAGKK
jgi:hypothetical protein